MKALRALGMDGAVTYAFLARLTSIAGSTGTVLLIVRFLSPVEQGYYYTLLSLVSLQVVFELGFSFVIQQLAAHECVRLEFGPNGSVRGDPAAYARLASAIQLSVRWYTLAAAAMALVLAPLGLVFFSRFDARGAEHVAWHGPWLCAVLGSSAGLWCMPFYSFLEGCGHVRAVAAMRFRQAGAAALCAWAMLLMHHGLYSPAMVIVAQIATGLLYVAGHRPLLAALLGYRPGGTAIAWRREVWPFQWRIAVSWTCSYFTAQVFIPILFALRGPVEAGQMGMSISITGYLTGLVLPWISTKATPFGRMIADGQFQSLDRLFRRTLGQALAVFVFVALGVCAGAALLPFIAPRLAARLVPPHLFAILVVAAGANCTVQCIAILLRSFKREPFLVQSLIAASLTVILAALTAPRWGSAGVAFGYLAASAGFALPSALTIFSRARWAYLGIGAAAAFEKRDTPTEFNRPKLAGAKRQKEGSHMIQELLRLGRVTKHLPYFRGIGILQRFYRLVLPQPELHLSVNDFDGDLNLDNLDVRETGGMNVWHRPEFYDKNQRKLFCDAIKPGSIVLDIGANIGVYTLLAAKRGARVFAIEADPRTVELLRRNIHLNGFDNRVTVFPIAVGEREGTVTLYRFAQNRGHSNLFEGTDPVPVSCRTIDSLDLPPIDVCKMDIEGSELSALKGMEATIRRSPQMKLLIEYAEVLGASAVLREFIDARFAPVYAIRQPPHRPMGPLSLKKKAPPFCDLWASRS